MLVAEIMSTRVLTVAPEETAESAFSLMQARRVRHLVVKAGKKIIGVVSDRDIGGPDRGPYRRERTVAEVMTPYAVKAEPRMHVRQAANLMRGWTIGCLPVVEGDDLVGIVTTSDLLRLIGKGAVRPASAAPRRASSPRLATPHGPILL